MSDQNDKPNLNPVRTEVNSLPSYGLATGSELVKKSDVLHILDKHLPQHSKAWKAGG